MDKEAPKTLKDIIKESDDLFLVEVNKVNKRDPKSWKFKMIDSRWTDPSFSKYKFRIVNLKRDNYFFIAYKSDDSMCYFVDPKKAMFKTSIGKYVVGLKDYSVKSNDISRKKNDPSFKVSQREMYQNKIDNYLDLCYYFRNYSAIGSGITRDVRNLIVLDIDVDCTKTENKQELNSILLQFAQRNVLPDFYVFNKESSHVQLQWLIRDFQYKDVNDDAVKRLVDELYNDTHKNQEVDYKNYDFTKMSDQSIQYKAYTRALCDLSKKRKFGDKNYTFWKAKNPMSALSQNFGLELKMPYYDGELKYYTQEQMDEMFSTREKRREYFYNAPTLEKWYQKLSDLLDPIVDSMSDKTIQKMVDTDEKKEEKKKPVIKKSTDPEDESRNNFVFECTKEVTWKTARRYGCRQQEHFKKFSQEEFTKIKKEIFDEVRKRYNEKDEMYNRHWPGTTNTNIFSAREFKSTFNSSFNYAIQHLNDFTYSDEDRKKSIESRHRKMDKKVMIVDQLRLLYKNIKREDLLKEVNKQLVKNKIKPISMGSLKRYIAESKALTDQDRMNKS